MSQDTYLLKGFVAYGALADNDEFDVAPLGELSVRSETFSKDRMIFGGSVNIGETESSPVVLSVFSSKRTDTGVKTSVNGAYADLLIDVGQWCYQQASDGVFSADREAFRLSLLAEYTGVITDIEVGEMVQQGVAWLPEFVVFYVNPTTVPGATYTTEEDAYLATSRIKLWFSDSAFQAQYDEFEIENIAPLTTLDDFFKLPSAVKNQVAERSVPELMLQVQTVTGSNPSTLVRAIDFNYIDPNNPSYTFSTTWTFVIYGAAGDNIDAIKEGLIGWILDNSTHTREEWADIFPDIFTSTEFILTPLWNQYAIPNKTLEEGIYSPSVNHALARTIAAETCIGTYYTPVHVDSALGVVGTTYKSVAMLTCGGPENREGRFRFEQQLPDYIAVSTTNLDFNRMSPQTQEWVMLLYKLLKAAEEITEYSDVPAGVMRMRRRNAAGEWVLYVTASYRTVQYLVVAKSWLLEKFPPIDGTAPPLSIGPDVNSINAPTNSQTLQMTFTASGGRSPYTFAATSPNLATGGINPVTGVFDGTFNDWGSLPLRIEVTDADNNTVGRDYVVDVIGT